MKETTKYLFSKIDKHQNGKNKAKRNVDGQGWRRLTQIANDELVKFRLHFSRCTNRDIAPLKMPNKITIKWQIMFLWTNRITSDY